MQTYLFSLISLLGNSVIPILQIFEGSHSFNNFFLARKEQGKINLSGTKPSQSLYFAVCRGIQSVNSCQLIIMLPDRMIAGNNWKHMQRTFDCDVVKRNSH